VNYVILIVYGLINSRVTGTRRATFVKGQEFAFGFRICSFKAEHNFLDTLTTLFPKFE